MAVAFLAGCGGIDKRLYSDALYVYSPAVNKFNKKPAAARERVVGELLKKLHSGSSAERDMAVIALGNVGAGNAVQELISSYKACLERVTCNRELYFDAFGKIGLAASPAVPLLTTEAANWNKNAILALWSIGPGAVAALDSLGETYYKAKRLSGYETWASLLAHTLHRIGPEGSLKVESVKERISREEAAEKVEKSQQEIKEKKRQEEIKRKQKKECPALLILMQNYQANGQKWGLSIGYEKLSAMINKATSEWSQYECDSWFSNRLRDGDGE